MKRFISIILLITIITTSIPVAVLADNNWANNTNTTESVTHQVNPFKDVSKTDWFYDSVMKGLEKGIFSGTGEDSFSPYGAMTRAMYVTIIGRMARVNPNDYMGNNGFTDVDPNSYYAPYVAWAVENRITFGVGNNHFDPNGIVNREQMAVFTVQFFKSQEIEVETGHEALSEPKDLSYISDWAKDSVLVLWRAGLLVGDGTGNFNPKFNATRAEAATFSSTVNKTIEKLKDETGNSNDMPPENTGVEAKDIDKNSSPTSSPSNPPSSSSSSSSSNPPKDAPISTSYIVTFDSNGGSYVEPMVIKSGQKLSNLPIPISSNAIFLGWHEDSSLLGDPASEEKVILGNITLYAKYMEITGINEEVIDTSFSLIDQEPSLSFDLISTDNNITSSDVKQYLHLEDNNGAEPIELEVSGTNGSFTVSAVGEFVEGASYKLTLNDYIDSDEIVDIDDLESFDLDSLDSEDHILSFADKDSQVRSCSFTINRDEINNVEFKDNIKYIPKEETSSIIKDNVKVDSFSVPLMSLSEDGNLSETSTTGTFIYNGDQDLQVGDTLCVYTGQKPTTGKESDNQEEEVAYIKVTNVNGKEIEYSEAEFEDVVFIPDVIPINIELGSSLIEYQNNSYIGSFKSLSSNLDFSSEEYEELELNPDTTIDVGDFLVLVPVTSDEELSDTEFEYAKVTSVKNMDNSENQDDPIIEVEFEVTTLEELMTSTSYYTKNEMSGEQILENTDIAKFESGIEEQLYSSGFVEKAANYLTNLTLTTDGFRDMAEENGGLHSVVIAMADGSTVGVNELRLMANNSKKVKLEDKKIKVKVNQKPKEFNKGFHCTIEVALKIHINAGDDNIIILDLAASFVEEIKINVNAAGDSMWKFPYKKVFGKKIYGIPRLIDYKVSANADVYNYTAVSFKAIVSTGTEDDSIDVSEQIEKILGTKDDEEVTKGVKELYEIYKDMVSNESEWIELFDQRIALVPVSLLGNVIQIRITVDFIAGANINVAIGSNFETKSGTRYSVSAELKKRDARAWTTELLDETYTFQFYVMGHMGLKAGIRVGISTGLFSINLNSIGIEAETGMTTKLYGFFFYEKKAFNKKVNTTKTGALYFELGGYLEVKLIAQALNGKYKFEPTIIDLEFVLLRAGERHNVFDFDYEETEEITFNNSTKLRTIPSDAFNMAYLDLKEGEKNTKAYGINNYIISFSDKRFSLNSKNQIVANIPSNIPKLEAEMTITWKQSTLAFSSVPISRKYRLVWDILNKNGYTISFSSNGGSSVKDITKQYGEKVSAPKSPNKTGYTFAGWYADKTLVNEYKFTTMDWKNITLYAKWKPNNNTKYIVEHYHEKLGSGKVVKIFGMKIRFPEYELVGKQILTGTTGNSVRPTVNSYLGFRSLSANSDKILADGSTVFKCYYNRNTYSLTFKLGNGQKDRVSSHKYGEKIAAPVPIREGYIFDGWNMYVPETMPTNNVTYTAKWKARSFIVSFDSNGGSSVTGKTVVYRGSYGSLLKPELKGYTFSGWYTSEINDIATGTLVASNDTFNLASNQVLYAKWEPDSSTPYTVEHYKEGLGGEYILEYTDKLVGTTDASARPAVKAYEGFTAPSTQTVKIKADGSTKVEYKYTRNSYDATFVLGEGEDNIVNSYKYEAAIVPPINPTRLGYTFGGWDPEPIEKMPASSLTYTAKWELSSNIPYAVEHYLEGLNGEYILEYTDKLVGTTDASVAPYVKAYDGFTAPTTQTVIIKADGSTKVEYKYTRNSFDAIFVLGEGEENIVNSYKYEATIVPPTNPTRLGYTFGGWDLELAEKMPATDITYTAKWLGNKYTINFNSNGGTDCSTMEVTYGSAYGELPVPTRLGYELVGFYDGEEGTSQIITSDTIVSISENHTLYARWELSSNIPYTVEHYLEGLVGEYYLEYTEELVGTTGASVTPDVKVYEGFTAPSTQTVEINADGSTSVRYEYSRNSYNVTFDFNFEVEDNVAIYKYDESIEISTNPMREGYVFGGWNPEPVEKMPATDITYTAQWKKLITVTFDSNEGTSCESMQILEGSTYGDLPTTTREGYKFVGWYDGETDNDGSGNKISGSAEIFNDHHTLYAKWELLTESTVELDLGAGKIVIYPDRYEQGGNITYYDGNIPKFIITGSLTAGTPLQVFDEIGVPVVYDITLRNANIIATSYATAVRFDSKNSDNTGNGGESFLVVNLRIEGIVKIEADTHSGIQGSGYSTINLSGTPNSTLDCSARQTGAERAIGIRFTVSVDENNIGEMKAGGVVTQSITDAQEIGKIKLNILFK